MAGWKIFEVRKKNVKIGKNTKYIEYWSLVKKMAVLDILFFHVSDFFFLNQKWFHEKKIKQFELSYEITQDPFLEVESTTGSSAGFLAAGVAGVSIPE